MNNADWHHCTHATVRRVGRNLAQVEIYICESCGYRLLETDLRQRQQIPLTANQLAFLLAIRRLSAQRGFPPTLREIGAAIGMHSTGWLTHTRDRLVKHRLITYAPRLTRSMLLTEAGRVAAEGEVRP